jgi:hypothetical protein
MNVKFRELADQADIVFSIDKNGDPEVICASTDIEKFAELIVKECLTIMQDATQSKLRLSDAIWNTKIHFGVEE